MIEYRAAVETYTLTFNTMGGSAISSLQGDAYHPISLAGYTPTRKNYTFDGWYADSALTKSVSSVSLTKDTTVYAGWKGIPGMSWFVTNHAYNGYDDVRDDAWYGDLHEGCIKTATQLGIVVGYQNRQFGPEDKLKIGEAIKIACMVHSVYMADGYDFTQGEPWYEVYVNYATANDIIKAGEFSDVTAVCSREQAAHIFAHALPEKELPKIKTLTPPDVERTQQYGSEIYLLYGAGILHGNDQKGTFIGSGAFTRAQAAAIVTRMCLPEQR